MYNAQEKERSVRRGDPVSLHPLTADQTVAAIFKIKPEDVKMIVAATPRKKQRSA